MDEFKSQMCVFEGMTSISALIKATELYPSSSRKIFRVLFDKSRASRDRRRMSFLRAKSSEIGFELAASTPEELEKLTGDTSHGGYAAVCGERTLPCLTPSAIKPDGLYFVLEGIEDPYNFGYTVRSLYASGIDAAILPERNWMSSAGKVAKSSAGCSELLPMFSGSIEDAVSLLKSSGYRIICANIRESESLFEADLSAPSAFVIGGEKRGISSSLLKLSDLNVRIPYGREFMGSLPSAASAAIIALEAARKNGRIK